MSCAVDYFGPTEFTKMNAFPSKIDHDAPDSPESRLIGGRKRNGGGDEFEQLGVESYNFV